MHVSVSCQKKFLWAHKGVNIAPHPGVGLVLKMEGSKKFARVLCVESLYPFVLVSKNGPRLTAIEEDGSEKRLLHLERACETDGAASPAPV